MHGPSSGGLSRLLVAAMVLVVASFLSVSIVARRNASEIDTEMAGIVENAMPSVRNLSAARGAVYRLDTCAERLARGGARGAPPEIERLDVPRAALDGAMGRYLALPTFREEPKIRARTLAAVAALERALTPLADAVRAGEPRAVELALADERRLAAAADEALEELVDYNASEGAALGDAARRARTHTMRVALVLDAVSVGLALVATVLAVVSMRRVVRSLEDANRSASERVSALEERSSELDQFAGRVAHDVLAPLTASSIALQFVRRRLAGEDERVQAVVRRGISGLVRTRELVEALLEFARAGARPEAGRAEVAAVLEDVVGAAAAEAQMARVDLSVDGASACVVGCSAGVLTSVVGNLVRNAIKHMGTGAERRVRVRALRREGVCRVEVEDTGPGVPAEQREAIFEPFVRGDTHAPGVGLGLATVKRLVRAHGGEVGVVDGERGGSVFWVELPVPG